MRMMKQVTALAAGAGVFALASEASAWTRPGHMVTAAIAWEELKAAGDAALMAEIAAILEAHPDRGPFEVAIDRETGEERVRRMFLECARWPDDARKTIYDRPLWHAAIVTLPAKGGRSKGHPIIGAAEDAFAVNMKVLGDDHGTPAERALALCWIMHLAGDIHQPLHTAQSVSPAFPAGDFGGGRIYVVDPQTRRTVSFHWFWDDLIHRQGDAESVTTRAGALSSQHPRKTVLDRAGAAEQFPEWRAESFALARSVAYAAGYPGGGTEDSPAEISGSYQEAAQAAADRRAAMAGYRLADIIMEALGKGLGEAGR